MAIGDIYRVTDKQFLGTRPVSNVYYYFLASGNLVSNYATGLAAEFATEIVARLALLQSLTVNHDLIEVVCMANPLDFATLDPNIQGDIDPATNGGNMTIRSAFQYRFNRLAPGQRSGFKRYVGLVEGQVTGDNWTPTLSTAHNLATALEASIETDDGVFQLHIVGAPRELGTNPPAGYRPASVDPMNQITTQVTACGVAGLLCPRRSDCVG